MNASPAARAVRSLQRTVQGSGRDHLPRVDAHADRQPFSQRWILLHAIPQLQRGAKGPLAVIAMRLRKTKDGHHRVPDEFLECASVSGNDFLTNREELGYKGANIFRVESFTKRGGPCDIRKEYRDQSAFFSHIVRRWTLQH